jgi:hypothetical protein
MDESALGSYHVLFYAQWRHLKFNTVICNQTTSKRLDLFQNDSFSCMFLFPFYFSTSQLHVFLSSFFNAVNFISLIPFSHFRPCFIVLEFYNNQWGKEPIRNGIVVPARQATSAGRIDSLESIHGLLKS